MIKDKEYFEKQIKGLIMIIDESSDIMVGRSYVNEKLKMILFNGINFHPVIEAALEGKTADELLEEKQRIVKEKP